MNDSPEKADSTEVVRPTSTVQLSVAGQVISVAWEDLLDPRQWFASEPPVESGQD